MSLPRCQKVHAKPRLQPVATIVQTGAVCQRQAVMPTLSAGNKSYAHNLGSQVPNPTTGFAVNHLGSVKRASMMDHLWKNGATACHRLHSKSDVTERTLTLGKITRKADRMAT